MLIKEPPRFKLSFDQVLQLGRQRIIVKQSILKLALLVILAAAGGFFLGGYTKMPEKLKTAWSILSHPNLETFHNFIKGKQATPRRLIIDIKHTDYQRLEYKRLQALKRRIIVTEEDSFVPARLTADGKIYKVKLRLKGDYTDHLEGDKWSLRIHVKGNNTIWGMKRFSIQSPHRSGYIKEWIYYEWARQEDLISLRYDFVEIILNGENLGIYALEESFSKELLEHNRRREGPILKFDESALIDPDLTNRGDRQHQADLFYTADITSFNTSKMFSNEILETNYINARQMLNDFRSGKRSLAQTFDLERTARLFAITDILLGDHALRWKNIRFYYNPVINRIEPIGYNMYGPGNVFAFPMQILYKAWRDRTIDQTAVYDWLNLFFQDQDFVNRYFHELNRITAPNYLEDFFSQIKHRLEQKSRIIYKDGPLSLPKIEWYLKSRSLQRQFLYPKVPIKTYYENIDSERSKLIVTAANTGFVPITIQSLECLSSGRIYQNLTPRYLPGRLSKGPLQFNSIEISGFSKDDQECLKTLQRSGDNLIIKALRLKYQTLGTDHVRTATIDSNPIRFISAESPENNELLQSLRPYITSKLLHVDPQKRTISINPGHWEIAATIIFPPKFKVLGAPATRIILKNHSAIISYSPLILKGTRAKPFVIKSIDQSGQGLTVISAGEESLLENVIVSGQSSLSMSDWKLTGAVTFYESDVKIVNSIFRDSHSEDLLNIIRSEYLIQGSSFSTSFSDAVDIDFGNGKILHSHYSNCGNDCIDLSGSKTTIESLTISKAGDKGISTGENSRIAIANAKIAGTHIAIASKDNSVVNGRNITIINSTIGLAAYQKKPEFAPAVIITNNINMQKVKMQHLVEQGSKIQRNGQLLPETPNEQLKEIGFKDIK
jgi:hypothetical protein